MHLDSIDRTAYNEFAKALFAKGGKTLADGVTDQVYQISHGVTWYTQKLFNTLYADTNAGEICVPEQVQQALDYIIKTQAYSYEEILFRLPAKQKMVLVALAKNGPTQSITAGAFVRKYSLLSASTVQAAMKGLMEKDFVTCEQGIYSVYDIFMAYWLKKEH